MSRTAWPGLSMLASRWIRARTASSSMSMPTASARAVPAQQVLASGPRLTLVPMTADTSGSGGRSAAEAAFTADVLRAYAGTPDPRLRELLTALIRHVHAFATETGLTTAEWMAGLEFLTAVGQKCDPQRQEFILLSDVLGLSSLVESMNAADGATEPTVLGPFYRAGAPRKEPGEQIGRPEDGDPVLIRGRVTTTGGDPVPGATLDVWQDAASGLYDIQDPGQPEFNLRGVFTTGPDGGYSLRTVRPVS